MESFKNVSVYELDLFVKRSTVADTKRDVAQFLLHYLYVYNPKEHVKQFVKNILQDEKALEKIVIVNECEYYETVLSITDYQMCNEEQFRLYKEVAETVFLHVSVETMQEDVFDDWKTAYERNQADIIDFLLDEYLLLKKWHKLIPFPYYKQAIRAWSNILTLIQEAENDR